MTVVPSLISHPAVPSHRRMTCPLFSPLGVFCSANAQITVATKAKKKNADFRIEDPPQPGFAQSVVAQGDRVNDLPGTKPFFQMKKGGNKSRPRRVFLNEPIVRRVLLSGVRSRAQPVRRRETVLLPWNRPGPRWKSCRSRRPG